MTSSAPRLFTKSMFFVLVVVATHKPRIFAIWIATVPTPPAPAWINTRSPPCSAADSRSACSEVSAASGTAAASAKLAPAGLSATTLSSAATRSASPPIRIFSNRAYTSLPAANRDTRAPTAATTPATSQPSPIGGRSGSTSFTLPFRIL
jgi:hypothetical protein